MPEVTINNLLLLGAGGVVDDTSFDELFTCGCTDPTRELVSVQNGVVFTTPEGVTPNSIPVGSTTTIDGVEYTLTTVWTFFGEYRWLDPDGGEDPMASGLTYTFTLEDADGNVIQYIAPTDDVILSEDWRSDLSLAAVRVGSTPVTDTQLPAGVDGQNKLSLEEDITILCFAAGTLIDTAEGRRLVEDLKPGDLVLTRDKGYLPLQWVGQRVLADQEIAEHPEFAAVILRAGALGPNTPERDTRVSPSHRVLVAGPRAELLFGENEVLVPAGHLVGMPGIERDSGAVTYVHIMFDSHQIVLGDGLWSESFQPADYSLVGLGAAQRDEILSLFPELAEKGNNRKFKAARMTLRQHEARLLFAA